MTKLTEEEAYEEGRSCAKPVSQEPVAYEFQHEDTGRTMFVEPKQVEWGFEKNNPRLFKVGPVYRHPAQDRYALNTLDLIAANEHAAAVEQQLLDAQARIATLEADAERWKQISVAFGTECDDLKAELAAEREMRNATQLELERVENEELAAAQAKIDSLMLEFCPEEMTEEQTAEWARNQRPAPDPFPFSADRVTYHKTEYAAHAVTDDRIQEIWQAHLKEWPETRKTLISPVVFARAIEAECQKRIAELESLHEKMVEFHGSSVRDAKRYRWLREHLNDTDSLTDLWPEGAEKTPTPDELDNAIDKALGE